MSEFILPTQQLSSSLTLEKCIILVPTQLSALRFYKKNNQFFGQIRISNFFKFNDFIHRLDFTNSVTKRQQVPQQSLNFIDSLFTLAHLKDKYKDTLQMRQRIAQNIAIHSGSELEIEESLYAFMMITESGENKVLGYMNEQAHICIPQLFYSHEQLDLKFLQQLKAQLSQSLDRVDLMKEYYYPLVATHTDCLRAYSIFTTRLEHETLNSCLQESNTHLPFNKNKI